MAAVKTEAPDLSLSDVNINWDRLDKTRFHVIGAILFTVQQGFLHPTAVVKTRMQVDGSGLSHLSGFQVFKRILKADGVPGIFRGFGTGAVGALPGRVLALTSLEMAKDAALRYTEKMDMSEATRITVSNSFAGLASNVVSCAYFVPLDVVMNMEADISYASTYTFFCCQYRPRTEVQTRTFQTFRARICQRLMIQGLPGMPTYQGPFNVVQRVLQNEGIRGLYRGFGVTILTNSPASALWWGAYGAAQHAIWRSLGYGNGNDSEKKPSQLELVGVQATAGTLAGACSSIITTPIDTIKTRLQVMDDYGSGRPSMRKTTRKLLEEDGWRGFYRGFGPRFLNMSLWGTSMIVTYELIKRLSVKRE